MKPHDIAVAVKHAFEPFAATLANPIAWRPTVALLANAVGLGMVLALVTYLAARQGAAGDPKRLAKALHGAGNLLFLCVGLTGTMILVNNNMVRAFAIAAAIALVRFKVKLDGKSANASLLFAILSGIACGLDEIVLAWILLATYVVLVGIIAIVVRILAGSQAAAEVESEALDGNEDVTMIMRADDLRRVMSNPRLSQNPISR
jgi:hypothetical protein